MSADIKRIRSNDPNYIFFNKSALSKKEINSFVNAFSRYSRLRMITINITEMNTKVCTSFATKLRYNKTLIRFTLMNVALSRKSVDALFRALSENTSIKELFLCNITNTGVNWNLAKLIHRNNTLENLSISYSSISDNDTCELIHALMTKTQLKFLKLSDIPLSIGATDLLIQLTQSNTNLTNLTLSTHGLDPESSLTAFQRLLDGNTIQQLQITLNHNTRQEDWIPVCESLHQNTALKSLSITSSNIGIAIDLFGHALSLNTTLTRLSIVHGVSFHQGVIPIAQALTVNTTLTYLHLGFVSVKDSGAMAFAEMLLCNTTLTELHLICGFIKNIGVEALCQSLHANTTLSTLNLGSNNHDISSLDYLVDLIEANDTLETIYFSRFSRTYIFDNLYRAMEHNSTLKSLVYTVDVNYGVCKDLTKKNQTLYNLLFDKLLVNILYDPLLDSEPEPHPTSKRQRIN